MSTLIQARANKLVRQGFDVCLPLIVATVFGAMASVGMAQENKTTSNQGVVDSAIPFDNKFPDGISPSHV